MKYIVYSILYTIAVVLITWRYLESTLVTNQASNVTKTHEVVRPDGSRVIDTVSRTEQKQTVPILAPDWFITVGAGYDFKTHDGRPLYLLGVNRRILGPLFVGGTITSDRTLGVQIGFEF